MNNFKVFLFFLLVCGVSSFECRGRRIVTLDVGESVPLTSLGFPGNYPQGSFCVLWVRGGAGTNFEMKCPVFDVRGGGSRCRLGRLYLFESFTRRRGQICGQRSGLDIKIPSPSSSGFNLMINFFTRVSGGRFSCTITAISVSPTPATAIPASTVAPVTPAVVTPSTDFKCICGTKNTRNRIVGGVATEIHEIPWQAALFFRSSQRPFCGGSLITNFHIMSAAHCTIERTAQEVIVGLMEHDVTTGSDNSKRVTVLRIVNHPNYNPRTVDFDFSVLTLSAAQTFSPSLRPICLPLDRRDTYEGVLCTISGWGRTSEGGRVANVLQKAMVRVISNNECRRFYRLITARMICAIGSGTDSCQGDSGGPLSCPRGSFDLAGVVSFGRGCGRPGIPAVYARITSVQPWIVEQIAGGLTCPRN